MSEEQSIDRVLDAEGDDPIVIDDDGGHGMAPESGAEPLGMHLRKRVRPVEGLVDRRLHKETGRIHGVAVYRNGTQTESFGPARKVVIFTGSAADPIQIPHGITIGEHGADEVVYSSAGFLVHNNGEPLHYVMTDAPKISRVEISPHTPPDPDAIEAGDDLLRVVIKVRYTITEPIVAKAEAEGDDPIVIDHDGGHP